jgi:hypothetical protein
VNPGASVVVAPAATDAQRMVIGAPTGTTGERLRLAAAA